MSKNPNPLLPEKHSCYTNAPRLVTDAARTAVENTDYLLFGEEIDVSPNDARYNVAAYGESGLLRHKFTGKERDTESGMDYFLARYYSGPMGRFLSVDPANAGALPGAPQSWNAYSYTVNRSLTLTDPDGRCPWCIPLVILAYEAYSTAENMAQKGPKGDSHLNEARATGKIPPNHCDVSSLQQHRQQAGHITASGNRVVMSHVFSTLRSQSPTCPVQSGRPQNLARHKP